MYHTPRTLWLSPSFEKSKYFFRGLLTQFVTSQLVKFCVKNRSLSYEVKLSFYTINCNESLLRPDKIFFVIFLKSIISEHGISVLNISVNLMTYTLFFSRKRSGTPAAWKPFSYRASFNIESESKLLLFIQVFWSIQRSCDQQVKWSFSCQFMLNAYSLQVANAIYIVTFVSCERVALNQHFNTEFI